MSDLFPWRSGDEWTWTASHPNSAALSSYSNICETFPLRLCISVSGCSWAAHVLQDVSGVKCASVDAASTPAHRVRSRGPSHPAKQNDSTRPIGFTAPSHFFHLKPAVRRHPGSVNLIPEWLSFNLYGGFPVRFLLSKRRPTQKRINPSQQ